MTVPAGGCLVVANQTVDSHALREAIEDRIADGRTSFYVLVPQVAPTLEASGWAPLQTSQGLSDSAAADAAAQTEAARRSLHRLTRLLKTIREAGGEAEGSIGSSNVVAAVRRIVAHRSFDEILVSTLPRGMSRWIRRDVAARLARMTGLPVTVIEAATTTPRA